MQSDPDNEWLAAYSKALIGEPPPAPVWAIKRHTCDTCHQPFAAPDLDAVRPPRPGMPKTPPFPTCRHCLERQAPELMAASRPRVIEFALLNSYLAG